MRVDYYLSACRRMGRDACVWCDAQGRMQGVLPLPARGHSVALDARRGRAVVFGRQPGFFAWAFELPTFSGTNLALADENMCAGLASKMQRFPNGGGNVLTQAAQSCTDGAAAVHRLAYEPLPLPVGRHFYGHGVYAPDGCTLYVTENDYVNARGVIGVYDARPGRGYARVGEFDSGGMGPHDIVLMPDGQTLCVANGGLQTHPDFGKSILNMATMTSSLVYLNRHTGQMLQTHTLEHVLPAAWRHLSLRHLAVDGGGNVWIGGQYRNADGQRPALVWYHTQSQDIQPVACPPVQQRAMHNYVGSVATNRRGTVVAASSPVAGQVLFWRVASATDAITLLDVVALPDVCGIAAWGEEGFLLSSGHGALVRHDLADATDARADGRLPSMATSEIVSLAWDNHLCVF